MKNGLHDAVPVQSKKCRKDIVCSFLPESFVEGKGSKNRGPVFMIETFYRLERAPVGFFSLVVLVRFNRTFR